MVPEPGENRSDETRSFKVLCPGTVVSRYKIVEKLGAGGMGVVYKAEDIRLKRHVALKFLPPHLTQDREAKERFVQEARAASALDHPNICTIHEIDETGDGRLFIAMACYEGETLKVKIEQGPLLVDFATDTARQICRGLAKAHAMGIVHRDIKPGNIFITNDDQVKILDFGLAKLAGQTEITKAGTALGTVAYMSPEQARGEVVDHRSDLWSVGVLLYQMLTGRLPFGGDHEQAVLHAIMNTVPEPLRALRGDVPERLERVVGKALEKAREVRYQNIEDLVKDLDRAAGGTGVESLSDKSIVVLAFDDISPAGDNEYFSDGLTEEIITDLSQIHALRVISRTSAMKLKGSTKDVKSIGRELGVRYVLEGSVRKAGEHLRITAQLIDAASDSHIWAGKYKGTIDDIFEIQEKVSRSIVEALRVKLSPEEDQRVAQHPISNVRAYEFYLRAKQNLHRFTEEGLERALAYLRQGLDVVGDNALLYAGIGLVNFQYINLGLSADEAYLTRAREFAQKALEVDPESAPAHHVLANIEVHNGHLQQAVVRLKRALAADPSYIDGLGLLIIVYAFAGRPGAALPLLNTLVEKDPLTLHNLLRATTLYWASGNFSLALEPARKAHEAEPDNVGYRAAYALVLFYNRRFEEALEMFDSLAEAEPDHFITRMYLFMKLAFLGKRAEAEALLTPEFEAIAGRDQQYAWHIGSAYAMLGAEDEAVAWLRKAVDRGFINHPMLAEYDPFLENIRGTAKFRQLLERVKVAWANFEV